MDIDTPARQTGRQTGVLPILTDGERKLLFGHRHQGSMVRLAQINLLRLHRAERVGDIRRWISVPQDDIDLFAVEFVDDIINACAAHAHTRANRVKPFLARPDGHLRATAWLAGNALDLDVAIKNLWHFQLK